MKDGRWEFLAIPMVLIGLGGIAIILLAGKAGLWAWLLLGAVGLVGLAIVAWFVMARPHPPAPPVPGSLPEPPDDGTYRLLLIADGVCGTSDLEAAISDNGNAARTSVYVVAPALGSRTARMTGDEQAYVEAAARLDQTLANLAPLGVLSGGRVGSHDPLQALEDGFREFPAHRVLFVVHEDASENWLEHGVVEAARDRYPVPVTALVVQAEDA
jgi:hypothetical protein